MIFILLYINFLATHIHSAVLDSLRECTESVYSAYLIPNVYTSNIIHYECISAKYSTLYELLTQDVNILAIRDNVVWFFPIKKFGLSSEDINCIVQYVIHNRLNSNGIAWELLRGFYSYAIEHNLLD